jgi:formate dehydrogenase alpha subunit
MVKDPEKIDFTINGKIISCKPGTSVLDAAKENHIKIPTLCNHPHLKPAGACRLCIVEDEKSGRIFASCVTPASSGMAIQTDSPLVRKYRIDIIRLMLANHPESCVLCNQGNRCELRQVAAELGVGKIDLYPMPHYTGLEEANPFIIRDLSKCILCGRCVRADHELVVVGAIDYNLRGFKSRPATVYGLPLEKSDCTFCGTCVSLCPTGALMTKNRHYAGSPQYESSTICGFCGVGCTIVIGSVDAQIVEVNPSHEDGTVNRSTLCVKGHFENDFLNSSKRLKTPLIRRNNELTPASWEEALDFVADRLISIKEENGPQSLAFLGSSKCTNEENYLFQKMARVIFGTNNIDNGGFIWGRHTIDTLNERLDGRERIKRLKDLERAELIFVLGADPLQSAPVAGYYLKRASRINKIPLIVVDPRKTELLPFASIWLQIAPQSDSALLNGLAAFLYRQNSYDTDFIKKFTEGFDLYRDDLSDIDLETVARITGIDRDLIEKAGSLMNKKRIAFVVGHGILQQRHGDEAINALINLALMTGSLGDGGKGIYLLSRENNQIGSMDMGAVPDYLPGRWPLHNTPMREYWEGNWNNAISADPGLDMVRMVEEAEKGNLKALYIMGENPMRGLPQVDQVRKGLDKLEFLVVQDILATETTGLADVVLPGAAFSEKAGSFTNMEGRIQSFEPAVNPPAEAKPDWEILDILLGKIGNLERYGSIDKLRTEISRLIPMYSDLGRHGNVAWIKEARRTKLFNDKDDGKLISFSRVVRIEEELLNKEYPFKAILGSSRYHLGSGTRTSVSDRVKEFGLKGGVEIFLDDIKRLNIKEGDEVKISSPYGSIRRIVKADKGLKKGLIFIPTAYNDNDVMNLIRFISLGIADSPGWKSCDVKIEKA